MRVGVNYIGWARCLQPSLTSSIPRTHVVGRRELKSCRLIAMHVPWHIHTPHIQPTDKITFLREAYCTFYEMVAQQRLKRFQVHMVRTVVVGGECKRGAGGWTGQSLLLVQTDGRALASHDN